MRVTLIDSPVANAGSIARALRATGAELVITSDAGVIAESRKLVLPGVGSFGAAMAWLTETGVDRAITTAVAHDAWLLGICVGHQLLFEQSDEMGVTRGLGLLPGRVTRFDGPLPVPQIGWNRVEARPAKLFEGVASRTSFYFVNSYAARAVEDEIGFADYGGSFTAAVSRGRIAGVQFHPEKSSTAGLRVLRNFVACS